MTSITDAFKQKKNLPTETTAGQSKAAESVLTVVAHGKRKDETEIATAATGNKLQKTQAADDKKSGEPR